MLFIPLFTRSTKMHRLHLETNVFMSPTFNEFGIFQALSKVDVKQKYHFTSFLSVFCQPIGKTMQTHTSLQFFCSNRPDPI